MGRTHKRGKPRDFQFVHNVRPAMALADPPKRSAMPFMTAGMIIALAALLMFVLACGL